MSQQLPFSSVPQERNIYIRYQHKVVKGGNKVRSGILERYTYKTDNGKLLKNASVDTFYSKQPPESKSCSELISVPQKANISHALTSNVPKTAYVSRTLLPLPTKRIIHKNVALYKIGNSSKENDDDKVRTEHCDSTTDIIESIDNKNIKMLESPKLFNDGTYIPYRSFALDINKEDNVRRSSSPQQSADVDSDSDCQIIDYKNCEDNDSNKSNNKDRFSISLDEKLMHHSDTNVNVLENLNNETETPITKVLNWIAKKEPQTIIHVISDSEDDSEYLTTFLCDKSGLETVIKQSDSDLENDCVSTSDNQKDANVNTLLNLNNDVSIKVPSLVDRISPHEANLTKINVSLKLEEKDPLDLLNMVKTCLSPSKNAQMISNPLKVSNISIKSNPPESCSVALERTPPKPKLIMTNSGKENDITAQKIQKLNVQIQRTHAPLSPESMKSEFYSYLKINTNPSAQKAEIVAQNRRSIRVKNLILQIEKNKEQNSIRNENAEKKKEKANDIRKKYMKYSKTSVVFPPPLIMHNKISDFSQSIESFFLKERIPYKLYKNGADEENINTIQKNKRLKLDHKSQLKDKVLQTYNSIRRNKRIVIQMKKIFIKNQTKRKKLEAKKLKSSTSFLPDLKLRRLRFGPNRILRNNSVRITRNSLDGYKFWSPKLLRARKAKLKAKMKKNILNKTENNQQDIKEEIKYPDLVDNSLNETVELAEIKPLLNNTIEDISKCTVKSEDTSLPNILARKLSEALKKNITKAESTEKQKSSKSREHFEMISQNYLKNKLPVKAECLPRNCSTNLKIIPGPEPVKTEKNTILQNIFPSSPISSTSENEIEFVTTPNDPTTVDTNKTSTIIEDPLRPNSCSPLFFGFLHDEKITEVCKVMQNIVTSLSIETDIKKSVVDLNVPELQVNSIPLYDNPEVMSLSSSDFNTSQEEPRDDEDSNSEEHYSEASSVHEEETPVEISTPEIIDIAAIETGNPNYIPLNQNIKAKSFHRSLMQACVKRKSTLDTTRSSLFELSDSDSSMSTPKTPKGRKSQTHEIDINKKNGAVFNAYYLNGILIIVQEQLITFWKQTALGNILGVQNMWLPHGSLQRIILDPGCVNRRSSEMILNSESSVAYIELWTKEHKCEYRECPIADVFATIYFHRGHGLPDKKVLQLVNIKGYGDDVRFAVIKNSREIIVSWCDTFSKPIKTVVRSYQLAPDFQTVSSIQEMECVFHYISSLHNIHDCDDLVLGAGNEQISVWNLRHGYLVTTLNLAECTLQPPLESKTICLYAQCDTGFLFLIQQTDVGILRLVAVNGMTQEWKQLHSYQVPENYKKLLGVIVESGVLMTCYTNGFLCWNMHSGEILAEIDTTNEHIVLPSNKYVVAIDNYQVTVQHIMSYILTHDW